MSIHSLYAVPRLSFHKIYKRQTRLLCLSISSLELQPANLLSRETLRHKLQTAFFWTIPRFRKASFLLADLGIWIFNH
ncbi:hypothetical protein M440DRAFT_133535 [Trichoderma longibrachiatum ATCC 18648]|uniref:Uncharacterized protein n=1 Tax=Trichoderma longibrachiatum ATCC 18648 TaxID=983965 RepID=A0A2T4BW53_TRILO|nr:hypothetical protein M440DRAFT_133535 [Trichoderma longibrachiatum ATCC 18648]